MKLKSLALAALAAGSFGAHAALATYAPWAAYWPQGGEGVGIDNVRFNVVTANGVTVAMGAHAYKNSEFLPNDNVSTYYAQPGTYAGPPAEPNRANWSFDFAWNFGNCGTDCIVSLFVDVDPTAGENFRRIFAIQNVGGTFNQVPYPAPVQGFGSYNMEMNFQTGNFALLPGNDFIANAYNFDPFGPSSTAFRLEISGPTGVLASSGVTVNVVPEPGTLALAGLALAGLASLRRRRSD